MNTSCTQAQPPASGDTLNTAPKREWLGGIDLRFAVRDQGTPASNTVLSQSLHYGPLRVQRPFYPESNGCCHIYLLHPPGGLVIGDKLSINLHLEPHTHTLITTPSAGKLYSAKGSPLKQGQVLDATVDNNATLEWLPQETILFNGANGELVNKVVLHDNAQFIGWDIARLGRVASHDYFKQGTCLQRFELWRHGIPLHIEKTLINADCPSFKGTFGLQGANTVATFIATTVLNRDTQDTLVERLDSQYNAHNGKWGITQKEGVFIARYLGDSVTDCRAGFEALWHAVRPALNGHKACSPRIWNT